MKTLIVTNVWTKEEAEKARSFNDRLSPDFRIITDMKLDFGKVWEVPDHDKRTVEWNRRILQRFIKENSYDILLKIDPDIAVKSIPEMPENCDVAGDFRKFALNWVWFGACQYYTKAAVEKILGDSEYTGVCIFQDITLMKSVQRLNLRAYNMEEVDMWGKPDSTAQMFHPETSPRERLPSGIIIFN